MSKGEETRGSILDTATATAARVGLQGLTIGSLAGATGLSKSGLFAHFGSKEGLQLEVLQHARDDFIDAVMRPALKATRGEPRLRELFERWLAWEDAPGGCIFIAASSEMDDEPGPVRDRLVRDQRDWLDAIAQVARGAVSEGFLRADLDPDQFGYELHGVVLSYHHAHRLLADPQARQRAWRAFDSLILAAQPDQVPAA